MTMLLKRNLVCFISFLDPPYFCLFAYKENIIIIIVIIINRYISCLHNKIRFFLQ